MLHSVFNFDITFQKDLQPAVVRRIHEEWRAKVPAGAWQSNTLNNHDQSRVSTHFAPAPHKAEMQRVCAALVLFLEGIPFLYYGEEIGMEDYAVRSFDELRDMVGAVYRDIRLDQGIPDAQILTELGKMSRDRCRTPMQWSGGANGGFSPADVPTWLPVHDCAGAGVNVDEQEADAESLLHFYRRMIRLRRENPALQTGVFRDLAPESERALVFLREGAEQRCLVGLNFSAEAVDVDTAVSGTVLYGDGRPRNLSGSRLQLAPFEILILEVVE
jgi:glycosidase